MRAIIKDTDGTTLKDTPIPNVQSGNDVVIKVAYAGLCRTDIYAADGLIDTRGTRILGHEFSGVITDIGVQVTQFKLGDRVTVMPVMPCGKCALCEHGHDDLCQDTQMLGLEYDGAFAEYIRVPEKFVYKLPDAVSFKQGAYSEPLAASLSVLKSGIQAGQKGLILGDNRFGQLIARILKVHGFNDVTIHDVNSAVVPPSNTYDFVIETVATEAVMMQAFTAAKPKGVIILKSRKHDPIGINFNLAVRKELKIQAVNYADFDETLALLARPDFSVDDLFGNCYPLDDFQSVFETAKHSENLKIFFIANSDLAENDNVRNC